MPDSLVRVTAELVSQIFPVHARSQISWAATRGRTAAQRVATCCQERKRGSGIVVRELAGVALEADAAYAAVLVPTLRLDEAGAIGAVGAHDVSVVFLAGDDGPAHEMEEDCEHGCRRKRGDSGLDGLQINLKKTRG